MQIVVECPDAYAPTLKSAVILLSDYVGARIETGALLQKEEPLSGDASSRRAQAFVDGAIACGFLRRAICPAIEHHNPDLRLPTPPMKAS
jgi:hypothetical protein